MVAEWNGRCGCKVKGIRPVLGELGLGREEHEESVVGQAGISISHISHSFEEVGLCTHSRDSDEGEEWRVGSMARRRGDGGETILVICSVSCVVEEEEERRGWRGSCVDVAVLGAGSCRISMGKCGTQNSVAAPDIISSTCMHLRTNDTSSGLLNSTITCNLPCRLSAVYCIRSVCVVAVD